MQSKMEVLGGNLGVRVAEPAKAGERFIAHP